MLTEDGVKCSIWLTYSAKDGQRNSSQTSRKDKNGLLLKETSSQETSELVGYWSYPEYSSRFSGFGTASKNKNKQQHIGQANN